MLDERHGARAFLGRTAPELREDAHAARASPATPRPAVRGRSPSPSARRGMRVRARVRRPFGRARRRGRRRWGHYARTVRRPAWLGRCGLRRTHVGLGIVVEVELDRVLDVVLDLAELAERLADRSAQLGQALRAHDDEGDDQDDEELLGTDVQHVPCGASAPRDSTPGPSLAEPRRRRSPIAATCALARWRSLGQVVRDGLHLVLQLLHGPSQDQHVTQQADQARQDGHGRHDAHDEPHHQPRAHAGDAT